MATIRDIYRHNKVLLSDLYMVLETKETARLLERLTANPDLQVRVERALMYYYCMSPELAKVTLLRQQTLQIVNVYLAVLPKVMCELKIASSSQGEKKLGRNFELNKVRATMKEAHDKLLGHVDLFHVYILSRLSFECDSPKAFSDDSKWTGIGKLVSILLNGDECIDSLKCLFNLGYMAYYTSINKIAINGDAEYLSRNKSALNALLFKPLEYLLFYKTLIFSNLNWLRKARDTDYSLRFATHCFLSAAIAESKFLAVLKQASSAEEQRLARAFAEKCHIIIMLAYLMFSRLMDFLYERTYCVHVVKP